MADQRITASYSSRYTFTGKEQDALTGLQYFGARYYDARISLWYGVDPMAEKALSWTPYNYCLNNPIRLVDPDGRTPYPITIRSFHPSNGFPGSSLGPGLGRNYSGDDRGFSNNPSSSARISHTVTADAEKGTSSYSKNSTFSSPTSHPYFGESTGTPSGYANKTSLGNSSIGFETGYSGTNPLAYGPTADIDNKTFFNITETNGMLNVTANVYGDDFPNTEMFIQDPSGQSLFLGADVRTGGNDDFPLALIGGANENIMNINVNIKLDDKGNFTGVVKGDRTYTVSQWNEMFHDKSANKE
jgi:RHS repeat-associated protein